MSSRPAIGRTLAVAASMLMLLSACGGGSGGSDDTPPSPDPTPTPEPEPTVPKLTLDIRQLPQGASFKLVRDDGVNSIEQDIDASGSQVLENVIAGTTLRIADLTPPQPQTHFLECAFDDTSLGAVDTDGSLKLATAPEDGAALSVTCDRSYLVYAEREAAPPTTFGEFSMAAYGPIMDYLRLNPETNTASWLRTPAIGEKAYANSGLAAWHGPLQTAVVTTYTQGKAWIIGYDETHGVEPWISDGSPSGTQFAGTELTAGNGVEAAGASIFSAGGKAYFHLSSPTYGLWESLDNHEGLRELGMYFSSSSNGKQVFMRTIDNALAILEPATGQVIEPTQGKGYAPISMAHAEQISYFIAGANALGVTDGTTSGTHVLTVDATMPTTANSADAGVVFQNTYYFIATSDDLGRQIWRSDGTQAGTVPVTQLTDDNVRMLTVSDDALYFLVDADGTSDALWKLDAASTSGAVKVSPDQVVIRQRTIIWNPTSRTAPRLLELPLQKAGNRLVFLASQPGSDDVLPWATDGTAAGTYPLLTSLTDNLPSLCKGRIDQVADAADNPPATQVSVLNSLGDTVLLSVRCDVRHDGQSQHSGATSRNDRYIQYWLTDGTEEGTRQVLDETGQPLTSAIEDIGFFNQG